MNGQGVAQDQKQSVQWFTKAAEQGYSYAQNSLGRCYVNGIGVVKDEKEAVKWYTKSAEQRNATGQNGLGTCYLKGIGVKKDEKKAFDWFAKSAEQGDATGQRFMGHCYHKPIGVAKDEKEAVIWYTKAAEKGDVFSLSGIAWIYATSNDPKMRNGKEALKLAQKAAQKCDKPDPYIYAAIAAAYAEQGDFAMAVTTQEKAISVLPDKNDEKELQANLKLYQEKKPWCDLEKSP